MQKSETIGNLTLALSKVQAQLRPAKENSKNPFFKSNYADLGAVWDSVRSLLAENELAIVQMPTDVGGVTTIMSHLFANLAALDNAVWSLNETERVDLAESCK
jgi:hypothetical protein